MPSPFQVFRRNQKTMMVVLTGLALFAFVLMDPLTQSSGGIPTSLLVVLLACALAGVAWIFGNQKGNGKDYAIVGALFGVALGLMIPQLTKPGPVVQTTVGSLSQEELTELIRQRQVANNFVGAAFAKTSENNFFSQPPYFNFFNHSGWSIEQDVVLGWLLNKEAEQQGIELSDEAVTKFISTFTIEKLGQGDFREILKSQLRVSEKVLYDILREQLRARMMQQMTGPKTVATPEQYWEFYRRLNVQAELDLTAVPVSAFVPQVKEPTDGELQAFFEQHKETFDNTVGPGVPGFRQPRKVRIAWLEADYETIEKTVPPVTDAEIEASYEENKETRWKNRRDIPAGPGGLTAPGSTPPASGSGTNGSGPSLTPPGGSSPATPETPATPEKPADKPATPEKPAEPADKPETPEKPATPGEDAKPEEEKKPASDSTDGGEAAAGTSASRISQVVFLQDDPAAADKPAEEAKPAEGDKPEAERKPVDAPQPGKPGETGDDTPETPATPPAAEIPEYQPLSEVRDQIRDEILRERTLAKMREKIDAAEQEMLNLSSDWFAAGEDDASRPSAEEMQKKLQAIAAEHNLVYGDTPLLSAQELSESEEYPIGKASEPVANPFERQNARSVLEELFAGRLEQLYTPALAEDPLTNNLFSYWKIADQNAHVPAFADEGIREQVLKAWKLVQARPLAQKRAEELAEKVRQTKAPMPEVLAEETVTGEKGADGLQLTVQSTPPFSWMRSSTAASPMPFSRQPPRMSDVAGVDGAGQAFMETVFQKLKEGETGVAPNHDLSVYYTVQVTRQIPDAPGVELMREQFLASGGQLFLMSQFGGSPVAYLALEQQREATARWIQELVEDKYQIQFAEREDPRTASR
ncbi:MAG: hypothetical protein KDA79_09960 [Planctomycetaceae bacterium]|nr:hypothetical protein [Planctomycetaceae bacterium]